MASTGKPRPKKTEQLGFKVDQALYLEIEEAAQEEHRKRNEFARLIFEWGFAEFKKAGSFDALIGRKTTIRKQRLISAFVPIARLLSQRDPDRDRASSSIYPLIREEGHEDSRLLLLVKNNKPKELRKSNVLDKKQSPMRSGMQGLYETRSARRKRAVTLHTRFVDAWANVNTQVGGLPRSGGVKQTLNAFN